MLRNIVWQAGWVALSKDLVYGGGPRFETHRLHKKKFNIPQTRCHVAAHAWATWHHTTCKKLAMHLNLIRPRVTQFSNQNFPCHLSKSSDTSPTMCEVVPFHVSMYGLYELYSQQFFFPIWKIEQNAISHSSDVHLTSFEMSLVRANETDAPICFEVIMITLIFGLKFYPWSRF
jgi:hypothetical protein